MTVESLGDPDERLRQIDELPLEERAAALTQLHDELKEYLDTTEA